jgi:hypothetical protein
MCLSTALKRAGHETRMIFVPDVDRQEGHDFDPGVVCFLHHRRSTIAGSTCAQGAAAHVVHRRFPTRGAGVRGAWHRRDLPGEARARWTVNAVEKGATCEDPEHLVQGRTADPRTSRPLEQDTTSASPITLVTTPTFRPASGSHQD